MAKRLASFVHVNGEVYGPEDDVPKEVAEAITNPRAWGEEPEPDSKKAPVKKAASSKSEK